MKYSKEWQDYLDSLNDCCRATHLTALHTKACVLCVNAVVKNVNKAVKDTNKVVKKIKEIPIE